MKPMPIFFRFHKKLKKDGMKRGADWIKRNPDDQNKPFVYSYTRRRGKVAYSSKCFSTGSEIIEYKFMIHIDGVCPYTRSLRNTNPTELYLAMNDMYNLFINMYFDVSMFKTQASACVDQCQKLMDLNKSLIIHDSENIADRIGGIFQEIKDGNAMQCNKYSDICDDVVEALVNLNLGEKKCQLNK